MDFIAKHTQNDYVMETTSMKAPTNTISSMFMSHPFYDEMAAKIDKRVKFDGDHLKFQREGEIHYTFAELFGYARKFYVDAGKAKALRVHRMLPVPSTTSSTAARERSMQELAARLKDPEWTAAAATSAVAATSEIGAIGKGLADAEAAKLGPMEAGIMAVLDIAALPPKTEAEKAVEKATQTTSDGKDVAARESAPRVPAAGPSVRTGEMPPLHEGDQYAIDQLERAPAAAATAKSAPPKTVAQKPGGFAGTDADFAVVTHPDLAEDEVGVMDVKLPPEIAALLEQSAKKINRGLMGSEDR
jgi:hypothetical protein